MNRLVYADCKECKRPIVYRQTAVKAESDKYCAQCWTALTKSQGGDEQATAILRRDGLFKP